MRRVKTRVAAAALALAVTVPFWASSTPAQGVTTEPNRVLIVLFDQMLPQYADQFHMPNFRGAARRGHELQERLPRLHGLRDRDQPQRDRLGAAAEAHGLGRRGVPGRGQPLARRRATDDAHHRRLSLTPTSHALNDEGYPKLADYLHEDASGTKFITVGEKSYAVRARPALPATSPVRPI